MCSILRANPAQAGEIYGALLEIDEERARPLTAVRGAVTANGDNVRRNMRARGSATEAELIHEICNYELLPDLIEERNAGRKRIKDGDSRKTGFEDERGEVSRAGRSRSGLCSDAGETGHIDEVDKDGFDQDSLGSERDSCAGSGEEEG